MAERRISAATPLLLIGGTIALGVMVGCPPRRDVIPPPVTDAMIVYANGAWPDSNRTQLEFGRSVMAERCNECHGRPAVTSESAEEWPSVVETMGRKSKLAPPEQAALLRFVLAARATATR